MHSSRRGFAHLPTAQINVTPMIDVMLVLLIIFMMVAPLVEAPVFLPKGDHAESHPEEPDDITLGIDLDGDYFLSTSGGTKSAMLPIAADALGPRLERLYRDRTQDRILYLKADQGLDYGAVQRAITIARRSGVRVVAAVAERRGTRMR